MKKYGGMNAQGARGGRGRKGLQLLCMMLCIAMVTVSFTGCVPYASTEEMTALRGDLDNALQEIESLNGLYAAAAQELAALKEAQGDAAAALDALQREYEAAKGALSALEKDAQAAQQEIVALKGQIADLQDRVYDLEAKDRIRIYIDQGHNPSFYHNSGSIGNGLYEQDLTYAIGVLLAEVLRADGRFEVCLSRPTADTVLGTDNDSSLAARVQGAKDFEAQYFISLHTNSFEDSSVTGVEVYTVDQTGEAYDFGNSLLQGICATTELRNRGMKNGSSLRVLKNATMPAVLVEMGFLSNPQDAALLSESPELFVNGIYNGILSYFNLPSRAPSASGSN